MYIFLPLLLLELFMFGGVLFFCLGCLFAALRAARAKRYGEAIARVSPLFCLAVFVGATHF